jgi:EpsI family protein
MRDLTRPLLGRPNPWIALSGRRAELERWLVPGVLATLALGLWVAIYFPTLVSLVRRWNSDANYSHGFLVPLVSVFLFKQSLESTSSRASLNIAGGAIVGAIVSTLAMGLSIGTVLVPSVIVESASMLLALAGLALLIGGWNWWRHLWAPIGFLIFMVPWPSELYSKAAFPLQLFSSRVAAVILELCGLSVLRDGNLIHLPGQTMHVAQACSGMRQLTAFLAIAACAALLVRRPLWYRVTLLISSVAIAFLVNVLRVTFTGLVIYSFGVRWTEGVLHTIEGLVMIVLGLGILLAEIRLLDWLMTSTPCESPEAGQGGRTNPGTSTGRKPMADPRTLRNRLSFAVVLLLVGLGGRAALARQFQSDDAPTSLARPLADFPKKIGAWVGIDDAPRKEVLDMMKLDDYLQRVYRHPSGQEVVLWISFSKTSRDQYHYPTVCMEGSGWTEEESERSSFDVPIPGKGGVEVQPLRLRFVKADRARQYVYYWYYLIGERDIDRAMRRLSQSTRLFLRGRSNASATVEIFTQSAAVDIELVDDLARRIAIELDHWIPRDAWSQSLLGAN